MLAKIGTDSANSHADFSLQKLPVSCSIRKCTVLTISQYAKARDGILKLLKVVGNEKLGGLKFLQLLGIGLGPWRSISILILNVPFANTKRISVSGLSSNMNRR
jgi:hypothetical protein